MALFPMGDEVAVHRNAALLERWERLAVVRNLVNLALEQKRQEQLIKANLSARVRIEASGDDATLLGEYQDFLPTLFGVSQVDVAAGGTTRGGFRPGHASRARREGGRHQVRAVLALRAGSQRRSGGGGAVLPLRGGPGAGGSALMRMLHERRLELVIVLTVVVLDQVTKMLVRNALALHDGVEVIPGFLDLTRVHNTGAAFGMMNGVDFAFKTVVMSMVALAALGGVGWYALSVPLTDVSPGSASPASSAGPWAT